MPRIIRIVRTAFVDPSWWRPKHKDDAIITDPISVAAWRERLKPEKDCCETKFRTQLVREVIEDNTVQNGVPSAPVSPIWGDGTLVSCTHGSRVDLGQPCIDCAREMIKVNPYGVLHGRQVH